ncbi:MAG: sugar transferase [Vampirovibrio sp.]|nr:sugar transferase [Vampirovibrio sp.]
MMLHNAFHSKPYQGLSLTLLENTQTTQNLLLFEGISLHQFGQWHFLAQQSFKRMVDIALSGLGLIVISPLLLTVGALIKFTSPGPVFYHSERIGKDYQSFRMIKFRTMRVDADEQRDELRKQANLDGKLFKLKDDPRITMIGKVLRATSLDELPQLLNVIKGDMSLVGPRPLPPDESQLFKGPYTTRYQIFPGITGAWQVNGRSNSDFEKLCDLELSYIKNWHLLKDIWILLKTIPAVLLSKGAC